MTMYTKLSQDYIEPSLIYTAQEGINSFLSFKHRSRNSKRPNRGKNNITTITEASKRKNGEEDNRGNKTKLPRKGYQKLTSRCKMSIKTNTSY